MPACKRNRREKTEDATLFKALRKQFNLSTMTTPAAGANSAKAFAATIVKSGLCLTTAKARPTPTLFTFPGLASQPWWKPEQFPWVETLEASYDAIKGEYLALRKKKALSDYKIRGDEHQLHKGQWDWHSYVLKGQRQESFFKECPQTASILESIPGFMTSIPFAYAFFSTLSPQSSIASHSAPCNLRLRCHFPLIVPDSCGIRVGEETREWKEGKALLFDDAYDHAVWNENQREERVVLLFDVWHPDLVEGERTAVESMFEEAKSKGWFGGA